MKTERTTLREAMSAVEEEFNANAIEGERIAQRLGDLDWSAKQVQKQVRDLRVTSDALDVRLASHESSVNTHNGQRSGTFEDQSYVAWCNANAASLSSERAVLDREVDSFNSEDAKLNGEIGYYKQLAISIQEVIDNQATQEAIVDQEFQQHKAHRQELVDAGTRIQAKLDEIQPFIDSCEDAIASGNDEYMKAQCGSMFDGNQ